MLLETFSVWFVLYHLCQAKNQGLIIPPLPPWPPMRSLAWTSAFVSPCLLPTPTPHFMVSPVPSHWVVPRVAAGSNAGGGGGGVGTRLCLLAFPGPSGSGQWPRERGCLCTDYHFCLLAASCRQLSPLSQEGSSLSRARK